MADRVETRRDRGRLGKLAGRASRQVRFRRRGAAAPAWILSPDPVRFRRWRGIGLSDRARATAGTGTRLKAPSDPPIVRGRRCRSRRRLRRSNSRRMRLRPACWPALPLVEAFGGNEAAPAACGAHYRHLLTRGDIVAGPEIEERADEGHRFVQLGPRERVGQSGRASGQPRCSCIGYLVVGAIVPSAPRNPCMALAVAKAVAGPSARMGLATLFHIDARLAFRRAIANLNFKAAAVGVMRDPPAALCRYRHNAAERALRGIALGRKSWLFAGSDRGGGVPRPCIPSSAPPSSTTSIPRPGSPMSCADRGDAAEPARRTPPVELAGQPAARSRRIGEHARPIRPDRQHPADKINPTYLRSLSDAYCFRASSAGARRRRPGRPCRPGRRCGCGW